MKRAAAVAGAVAAALCLAFFIYALRSHWAAINDIQWGSTLGIGMTSALALYCATFLTGARSWQLVLRTLGERIDYRAAIGVVTISQFAKYLPGNVGHHLGRVLLARRIGVRAEMAISSIALDTVVAISAAAFCSIAALQLLPEISARYGLQLARNLLIAIALTGCAVVLALAIPSLRRHLTTALRVGGKLAAAGNRRRAGMAWVYYLASFGLGAFALGCIATSLGAEFPPFHILVGVYAVAWLIGFLVPGAPAGLGVREALLVLGLSPLTGAGAAIATTALFRMVTVVGDGVAFILGWVTASGALRSGSAPNVSSASACSASTMQGRDETPER